MGFKAFLKEEYPHEGSLAEIGEHIQCKGYVHRTWIPSKLSNMSKLELHYWDGNRWKGTGIVRFVPSFEWGYQEVSSPMPTVNAAQCFTR